MREERRAEGRGKKQNKKARTGGDEYNRQERDARSRKEEGKKNKRQKGECLSGCHTGERDGKL